MFNQKVKNEFLKHIKEDKDIKNPEQTSIAYGTIFKSSEDIESKYNLDLHSFNLEKLDEFFEYRNPSSRTSSRSAGRIVTKYINWAIDNNYSVYKSKDENPLNVSQSYFNKFVKEENTQYLSYKEINSVLKDLVNDQDAVIIQLLFHGVQGKEASEIRNLKFKDVDFNKGILNVKNDKTGEYREVDLKDDPLGTLRSIKRAYLDPEYVKRNGKMEDDNNGKIKSTVLLPTPSETPYVVKTGKTQGLHFLDRASQYTVYNRLDMIKSLKGNEDIADKLTTVKITRSGMIYEAVRLLETEGGELDNDKLKRICKKYNVKNHWAVKDFINMDVIESIYGKIEKPIDAK
jgi:integrase